jgi:hypothetical protein
VRCIQRAIDHSEFNLQSIASSVFFIESFDDKYSNVGQTLLVNSQKEVGGRRVIDKIADFYKHFLERLPDASTPPKEGNSGIVYSEFREAFVRVVQFAPKNAVPLQAELFTSPAELFALAKLVGPQVLLTVGIKAVLKSY